MRHFLLGLFFFTGCSPAFNWRDIHPESTTMRALFPCKPEKNDRFLALGGQTVRMTMLACEAGGASFTLLYADTQDIAGLSTTLRAWRQATLRNVRAEPSLASPFVIPGASDRAAVETVTTRGMRQDGSAMSVQALWFAVGSQVFQATLTADVANPAAAETFFAGFRTQ